MVYKICVVTGTRADYGLLRELLFKLEANSSVDLDLLITGSHLSKVFGNTKDEIIRDGFCSFSELLIPIEDDTKTGMANATGVALCKFTYYFKNHTPQLLVVLGDRYEILAAVIAARMIGIPVAHISGGDVTEGAIDDAIRHCITKMSQIHFPGCEQSRMRIIQMGEEPKSVFNVGEPGVENCLKTKFLCTEELSESLNFPFVFGNYSVVTFHPVTMEKNTGIEQVKELIRAMNSMPDMAYIITMANADAGGRAINELWLDEGRNHNNWLVVTSLGVVLYLSALKYAKLVIGNSSSGIVEAPSIGIPTINIGDRQKGRMLADSIISCEPKYDEILNAMRKGLNPEFQERAKHVTSPFGDGHTSELIEKHIVMYLNNKKMTIEKHFYDVAFTMGETNEQS